MQTTTVDNGLYGLHLKYHFRKVHGNFAVFLDSFWKLQNQAGNTHLWLQV